MACIAARRRSPEQRERERIRTEKRRQQDLQAYRAYRRALYALDPERQLKRVRAWIAKHPERHKEHTDRAHAKAKLLRREDLIGRLLRSTRSKTLKAKHIKAIWPKNNCCPVFGDEFFSGRPEETAPALVRIDETQDFAPGNILVLTKRAADLRAGVKDSEELRQISDWLRCLIRS